MYLKNYAINGKTRASILTIFIWIEHSLNYFFIIILGICLLESKKVYFDVTTKQKSKLIFSNKIQDYLLGFKSKAH
jgi:hypothetical protein